MRAPSRVWSRVHAIRACQDKNFCAASDHVVERCHLSNALLVWEMWHWADDLLSCRGHDTQNRLLHAGSPGVPQESRRGREGAKKTPLGRGSCSLGPCWLLYRVAISFRARAAPSQQLLQEGAKPKIEVTSNKRLAMEPATIDKSF